METYQILLNELQKIGCIIRTASVKHIPELESELYGLRNNGMLHEQFYQENLSWLDFHYANAMQDARSILVIACPQFKSKAIFEYMGKKYDTVIPPTYVYGGMIKRIEETVGGALKPNHFGFRQTKLPEKLLAVRTGLSMYGRNNISYIDGMGSFYRLFTYYTDMQSPEDHWQEKRMMPECGACSLCQRACPTGCISRESYLIQADKCITCYNERKNGFPEWFLPDWHNALVGCMICQAVCPKNKEHMKKTEYEVLFDAEETEMILGGKPFIKLTQSLKAKLDMLNITDYYDILPRNLSLLLRDRGGN